VNVTTATTNFISTVDGADYVPYSPLSLNDGEITHPECSQ